MLGLHGPCRGVPGARRGRGQQMLLAPSSSLHGPAKHVNGKIKILIAEEEAFQDRCSGTCPLLSLFVTLLLRSLPLLWHRSLLGDYLTSSLLHQTHAGLFSLLLALIQHPSPAGKLAAECSSSLGKQKSELVLWQSLPSALLAFTSRSANSFSTVGFA